MRSLRSWWRVAALSIVLGWVLVQSACLTEAEPVQPLSKNTHAILNGAPDLSMPGVGALVVNRSRSFCTASLVTKRLVLTAAHCVEGFGVYGLENITFRTDVATTNGSFTSSYHVIESFEAHPLYSRTQSEDYDIAVLVLKAAAADVDPIPVSLTPMEPGWVGKTVKVVGYGYIATTPKYKNAEKKYAAEIPLVEIRKASFLHYDKQTAVAQRKSACHGDSGGPAFFEVFGKLRILGVTSRAHEASPSSTGQTLCDGGAISTRIDTNLDFLRPYLLRYADGPAPCQQAGECGACQTCSDNKLCEPLPIAATPKQCAPCQTDADCGGGICYRFSDGFRCLQACDGDGCCPTGTYCKGAAGTGKSSKVCWPLQEKCGSVTCQSKQDCGPGEACENGKCGPLRPARSKELCQACTSNSQCGKGVCFGEKGTASCTQPCGEGDFCPEGFVCGRTYASFTRQCLPEKGSCRLPCGNGSSCPSGMACTAGFCVTNGGDGELRPCAAGSCKPGLQCVKTAFAGERCMKACGVPAGQPGTVCKKDADCEGASKCYPGVPSRCLIPCTSGSDCYFNNGGGVCSANGQCLCRVDSECREGYFCNAFTTLRSGGKLGACAPKDKQRSCGADSSCAYELGVDSNGNSSFCVEEPRAKGRSHGQFCDTFSACQDGLGCLLACFEICTKTNTCKLGGQCLNLGNDSVCACSKDSDCQGGRTCDVLFTLVGFNFGVCRTPTTGTNNKCLDNTECPWSTICKGGRCVAGARPVTNPPAEQSVDAGVVVDGWKPSATPSSPWKTKLDGGCQVSDSSTPFAAVFWLLLCLGGLWMKPRGRM